MHVNAVGLILALGITKIALFIKDIFFSKYFGVNHLVDIYFFALIIPVFLYNLFAGSFNSYFIPMYLKVRLEQGEAESRRYASSLLMIISCILAVMTFLCGWVCPAFILNKNMLVLNNSFEMEI